MSHQLTFEGLRPWIECPPEPLWHDLVPDNMIQYCPKCGETHKFMGLRPESGMCQECHEENFSPCYSCKRDVENDTLEYIDDEAYCPSCYEDCVPKCERCQKELPDSEDRYYDSTGEIIYCEKHVGNTLEVNGDVVVTDTGKEASLHTVRKFAPHLLKLMRRRKEWEPKTHIVFDGYDVEKITSQGILIVGCHEFHLSECERFVREDLHLNIPRR